MTGGVKSVSVGLLVASVHGADVATNPLAKVVDLMHTLKAKVIADGEAEAKAFHAFFEWCDDASSNNHNTITTLSNKKAKLEAEIEDLTSSIVASTGKVDDLAAAISSATSELKDATLIRDKEASQFSKAEADLAGTVDALARAIGILEKEMATNPSSFAQMDASSMSGLLQALSALVDAAALSSADHQKLVALVQSQDISDDDDDAPGAPAAATYKTHSGNILDVLEDMKEKAETELSDSRKAESNAKHNFNMLKQSLEDEATVNNRHMKDEKTSRANAEKDRAIAQGDHEVTSKALQTVQDELATAQGSCMTTAADHQATVAAREEELKVIEKAISILQETSSGAVSQTYSMLQVAAASKMQSHADLAKLEVVTFVKTLARTHHSSALAQLASRIAAVTQYSNDPFAKVKGLIQDMIMKLEQEAQAAATEKAWCDEQLAKTEAKKQELDDDIEKLTTKIDMDAARSAQLKAEVKDLQANLAALAKRQADMDRIRQEENAAYTQAKADLEFGLSGVRQALDVLRSYYESSAAFVQDTALSNSFEQQPAVPQKHEKSSGAGQSIIGILEVVESDFAGNLAKEESEESDAADEYERVSQENKVSKATMSQDVKYKTQEFSGLDKSVGELSSDRASTNSELSSVMEYYGQVKDRCIAKPETYEERQAKRQAEIAGLKQALSILENDTAFVQRRRSGSMRGALEAR